MSPQCTEPQLTALARAITVVPRLTRALSIISTSPLPVLIELLMKANIRAVYLIFASLEPLNGPKHYIMVLQS